MRPIMNVKHTLICLCCVLLLSLPTVTTLSINRRRALLKAGSGLSLLLPQVSIAADTASSPFKLEVTITVPSNIDKTELLGPDTALYVTARPTDNSVSAEVLQGRRIPPVLTTRAAKPSDLKTILTEKDATPEGMSFDEWKSGPLVVSARLDTDGFASTRNATDLVGQGTVAAGESTVTVPLQGRGFAGKFLTGR